MKFNTDNLYDFSHLKFKYGGNSDELDIALEAFFKIFENDGAMITRKLEEATRAEIKRKSKLALSQTKEFSKKEIELQVEENHIPPVTETEKKMTSENWYEMKYRAQGILVLDPDGWDRKNYQYSWYEEKITDNEFNRRLGSSTIQMSADSIKSGIATETKTA